MWILRQYIFGNVTYPLSLNYSFDSFLWSFPILSSYMSQSTFSFDFLPSLIFSHCYFCVCVFRDLCNSHHSNTSPGLQDFCSSLHTHYFSQPSLPFSFSFLVRMEPGELAQVWMCLSRVIEENTFLKTCSRSWRQLWRQPCCPAMGWAKCESGAVLWPENKSCDEDSGASPLCLVCCRGLGSPFLSAAELCQCSDFSERCHTWAWKRVVVRYLPCIREGWHILAFAFTSSNSSTLAMRRNIQWSLFLSLPQ